MKIKLFFFILTSSGWSYDDAILSNFICGRVGENYLGEHEGHSDGDGSDDDGVADDNTDNTDK